jgi:hypothetical protein
VRSFAARQRIAFMNQLNALSNRVEYYGLDHIVILGGTHLRRVLRAYTGYYNFIRTHRSLDKDAPISRPVQRTAIINSQAVLGGLHHHYVRV